MQCGSSDTNPNLSPIIAKDTVAFLLRQDKKLIDEKDRLAERQYEVLQLLAEGKSMKEIAAVLNISYRSVTFHKYSIEQKLNIKNSAELVRYAVRNKMLLPYQRAAAP